MIRPKDLNDCDCSPWQKLKMDIQVLFEAVTNLGYKNTEQDEEIDALDDRVTALERQPSGSVWGEITGDLDDQTDLKDALAAKADSSSLAAVATSGSYDDLTDKPIIEEQVQADWDQSNTDAVDYIKNKPTIPAAPVQSDWNEADSGDLAYIKNKPTIPAAPVQSDWNEADSGDLAYIKNKPTIPAAQVNSDWNAASGVAQILNKPTVPPVMLSGSSDPTVLTAGVAGQFYQNTSTGDLFLYEGVDASGYIWSKVNGGSGGDTPYHLAKYYFPMGNPKFNWDGTDLADAEAMLNSLLSVVDFGTTTNVAPEGLIMGSDVSYSTTPILLGYAMRNDTDPQRVIQYTFIFTGVSMNDGPVNMTWQFTKSGGVWNFTHSSTVPGGGGGAQTYYDWMMFSDGADRAPEGAVLNIYVMDSQNNEYRGFYMKNAQGEFDGMCDNGVYGMQVSYMDLTIGGQQIMEFDIRDLHACIVSP